MLVYRKFKINYNLLVFMVLLKERMRRTACVRLISAVKAAQKNNKQNKKEQ